MKIKLDENIPARLVDILKALGYDMDTVAAEGLTGQPDERIWTSAQAAARFLHIGPPANARLVDLGAKLIRTLDLLASSP